MTVFNNYLYVGTENNSTIGETWRSLDAIQWERVGQIVGTTYPPIFAPTIFEDNRFFAWGSRSRNSNIDTLYFSKDGLNWSPVLISPNNTFFNGFAVFNFEGNIYTVSPISDLMNNVWKLTRTDSNACPLPRGDINGDGKIGLEDAIHDLQVVSGIR